MERAEFIRLVVDRLESARDALARIEAACRAEDRPEYHALSRLYAQFCMQAREFLSGAQMGRPLPRRFAKQMEDLMASLVDYEDWITRLGLSPSLTEFLDLSRGAQAVT